jgi:hypothetical protein
MATVKTCLIAVCCGLVLLGAVSVHARSALNGVGLGNGLSSKGLSSNGATFNGLSAKEVQSEGLPFHSLSHSGLGKQ